MPCAHVRVVFIVIKSVLKLWESNLLLQLATVSSWHITELFSPNFNFFFDC